MRAPQTNHRVATRMERAEAIARLLYPDADRIDSTYFADSVFVAVWREWTDGYYGKQHVLNGEVIA